MPSWGRARTLVALALSIAASSCTSQGSDPSPATTPVARPSSATTGLGRLSALGLHDPRLAVAVGDGFRARADWHGAGASWRGARFSAPAATRGHDCVHRVSAQSGPEAKSQFVALRPCRVVLYATAIGIPGPLSHPAMFLIVNIRRH